MLAPQLPLPIPTPVAQGEPDEGYPYGWSVYRWLEGSLAANTPIADPVAFATDLAGFLRALAAIDATGGPEPGQHNFFRGGPLGYYEREALEAIERLGDEIPRDAVQRTWADAMASEWERDPVWFHGDVATGNLLVRQGRLAAVLDFGSSGVGDPACDMAIAWTFLVRRGPRPLPRRARRRCRHLVARPRLDAVEVADHDGRSARGGRRRGGRRAAARDRRHHRRLRRRALSVSALSSDPRA